VFATGAANGIGLEYCREFAKLGFNLVMVDLDQAGLDKSKTDIQKESTECEIISYVCDLAALDSAEHIKETFKEALTKDISIVVSNAGISSHIPFEEVPSKTVSLMINLHCNANVLLMKFFYERLQNRTLDNKFKSAYICMASSGGLLPVDVAMLYCMTKTFLLYFIESVSNEASRNFDLLSVCPGYVSTDMTCYRKENDTITPNQCAKGTLKELGHSLVTTTHWATHIKLKLILNSLWHISHSLLYNIFEKGKKSGNLSDFFEKLKANELKKLT
jgi:3-hydroxybutyrate dehydrogenase